MENLIRVMSYNVRNDNIYDVDNRWTDRRYMVASTVRFHRACIVGMQEVLKNQLDDLNGLLPEYGSIGVGRDDGKDKGEFSAIFYLKDRFEPLDKGNFWLSENPDIPGKLGWDADCVRIATWARFNDIKTGEKFYHFNTHLDHVGVVARRESAKLLLEKIREIAKDEPAVLTGDFNSFEDSDAYKIITGKEQCEKGDRLYDAKYISKYPHHGPSESFEGFNIGKTEGKIDYIFVKNGIKVISHGILADHFDFKLPSDHMPVVSDIYIGK